MSFASPVFLYGIEEGGVETGVNNDKIKGGVWTITGNGAALCSRKGHNINKTL